MMTTPVQVREALLMISRLEMTEERMVMLGLSLRKRKLPER